MAKPNLSVIIPAYNEEENIVSGAPQRVLEYLQKQKYTWEVIFVDDGSTDKTADMLEKFSKKDKRLKVIRNPHQGKAGTVIKGMLSGNGEIILFTDMDQATPLDQIEKFFPYFKEGFDIVIGSRSGRKGAPLIRKLMAATFVLLRTIVLRLPFKDTQTGFKAFSYEASQDVFRNLIIFGRQNTIKQPAVKAGFDLEFLYVARKRGYKIKEVPVVWNYQGSRRVSAIRDGIDSIKDILRIRWYALKGSYREK
jgi:dolichyl-phosphate beta-glucosyltransferase